LGTTASIWFWMTTVVSGCHMKKLPNQKALSAVCLRFPKRSAGGEATATTVAVLIARKASRYRGLLSANLHRLAQ
jgi:hypothetical protein